MEITVPDLEDLRKCAASDSVIRLYRYWLNKRGARAFPSRKDIDPLEFRFAIGRVSLVDVMPGSHRFHYRLVSTALSDRLGYEMTGKFSYQIRENEIRQYVEDLYGRTLDARMPIYEKSTRTFDNALWQHEALLLPLSSDQKAINMLMVYRWTDDPAPVQRGSCALLKHRSAGVG